MVKKKDFDNAISEEYKCLIDAKGIFSLDKTKSIAKIGGTTLTKQEKLNLQNEVKFFNESRLKGILLDTLYDVARKTMFEKSETFDDMLQGKMMLYNISVQKNILRLIEEMRLDGPVNSKTVLQQAKKMV